MKFLVVVTPPSIYHLSMTMKLWHGYWKNQLERMNMMVNEYNGIAMEMLKGRLRIA